MGGGNCTIQNRVIGTLSESLIFPICCCLWYLICFLITVLCACPLSSPRRQGIQLGRSASSQLASLVLIYRELICGVIAPCPSVGCRDYFMFLVLINKLPGHTWDQATDLRCQALTDFTIALCQMNLTSVNVGPIVDFLEFAMSASPPLIMCKQLTGVAPGGGTSPSRAQKLICPQAPKCSTCGKVNGPHFGEECTVQPKDNVTSM